jgi:hypothetical protein
MKNVAACAMITGAMALFGTKLSAQEPPSELRATLPGAALAGQATMRVWGFDVYRASLWVPPGFSPADFAQHAFALELSYLRDFAGADIAKRSLSEMRRQGPIESAVEVRWEAQMRAVFPDVKAKERITGIHQPGVGAVFLGNGRPLGEIRDPAFAKAFFGIWLSPQTSEPRLRTALLARAQTVTVSPVVAAPASP